ncbi:DUF3618 domain-containing protein [Streptomyces griseoviridis]|jgi:hypothetical protein|uniref:DUF3618 domain-containing protein n=3 Tax=Streptomyces TaxID=1883 RepID=A0ABT9LBR0_STRGD|nr:MULTISPECIES: DUF3618 domain-containing protein [Streptomyces]MDP9681094.1 hypothetical protein [Streptomyces griseoviridis]GGS57765.1 hypothetical protein GCM10010238_53860 [Streptomyces niveoruber]GGT10088.1 hypothetical protein GCM10010240_49280 [Streptomyces griseoviridis]GGU53542.1 hypothetical protein GCM10010259_50950 [Streptomyces daghestanicus]GHI28364.1 hypothetical protein Sdagh_00940 [Streptomyces daghestanicus]
MTERQAGVKGPDELRRQIARARGRGGAPAGRVDVKGRAQARAADLRDKAGALTVQLRSSAAQAGHTVQDRASRAGLPRSRPVLVAGAVAGAVVAAGVLRRGRR